MNLFFHESAVTIEDPERVIKQHVSTKAKSGNTTHVHCALNSPSIAHES